jgi:YD repeat-containing protein
MSKGIVLTKRHIVVSIVIILSLFLQPFSLLHTHAMEKQRSSISTLHPSSISQGYGHSQAGRNGSDAEYIFHPTSEWTSLGADLKSGNLLFHTQLPILHGIALDIPLELTYNSFNANENSGIGNGWILNVQSCLQEDSQTQNVRYIHPSGAILLFAYQASTQSYSNPYGFKGALEKNPDDSFTLTMLDKNSYEFDTQGTLTQVKSPQGVGFSITYTSGLPTAITDDVNSSIGYTLSWNANGILQSITDGMNQTWSLSYDTSEEKLTSLQKPDQTTSCTFSYDQNSLLTGHQDFAGFDYTIEYTTTSPYPIANWKTPAGDQTTFQFLTAPTPYSKKTEVKDAEDKIVSYYFGSNSGHLEKISQIYNGVESKQSISYTQEGWIQYIRDSNDVATEFGYDDVGHVVYQKKAPPSSGSDSYEIIRTYSPPDSMDGNLVSFKEKATPMIWNETVYQYNDIEAPHLASSRINALGETTTYDYNAFGQLLSTTNPTETGTATTTYSYHPTSHFLSTITYADANESSLQYNHNGYISQIHMFEGDIQTGTPVSSVSYTYDSVNQITATSDTITNEQSSQQYGVNGETISWTSKTGCTQSFSYTQTINDTTLPMSNQDMKALPSSLYSYPYGLLSMGFQSLPEVTVPQYSPNPYTKTDALNHQTTYTYLDNGHVASKTDHIGNTVSYSYDAYYNKNAIQYPDGTTTQITYDNNNLPVTSSNPREGTITWQYNDIGQITVLDHPIQGTINYSYSIRGDVLADEHGTYSYDLIGRKTSINYVGGGNDVWTYTPDGLVREANGIQYTYTPTGRVSTWQEETNGATFNYQNGISRLNLPGSITGSGELNSYAFQYNNKHLMYSLDNTSKSQQGSFSYTYTDQNQLASITNPNNTQYLQTYSNKIHDQSKVLDSSGQNEWSVTDTQFNSLDQRTTYQHSVVAGQNQFSDSHSFQYYTSGTHKGKMQSITTSSSNQTMTYSYSQSSGLLETIQDSLLGTYTIQRQTGNRRISSIVYPGGLGSASFTYGASLGKLSNVSLPGNASIQLSWDSKNQISNVSYTEIGSMISYSIDYNKRGQMTYLARSSDGIQVDYWVFHHGPNGLEKAYKYSPNNILQITQNFTTDVHGRILSMTYTDSTPQGAMNNGEYYFHNDNLGNVTLLTDQMGNPVASYEYDIVNNKLIQEWNPQNLVNIFLQKGIMGSPILPLGAAPIGKDFVYIPPGLRPELGTDPGVIVIGDPDDGIDLRANPWNNFYLPQDSTCGSIDCIVCCYTCYEYIVGDDPRDPDDPELYTVEYAEAHSGDEIRTLCLWIKKESEDQKCGEVGYTIHQEYDNGEPMPPVKMVCILDEQYEDTLEY